VQLSFATPRKLPKAKDLDGRVVVVDIAFASEASGGGFEGITKPFVDALGKRLAAWVDHHDSKEHARYADDPRFVLATKAQHGACPEMVTPELVSAAKWIRKGIECYPGADADARAIDTRIGVPSDIAVRFDRAIRARHRDIGLFGLMVRHLSTGLADRTLWEPIDAAGKELVAIEEETRRIAKEYVRVKPGVAIVDCTGKKSTIDKTQLLLIGQERERVSVVVDHDSITLAAAFDSGLDFLQMLGLSGGMPTRVSVPRSRLADVWKALGVDAAEAQLALRAG
jgi:hypothetical protein